MANNYVRPALAVYQQVDDTVKTTGEHLATCIVGQQFELYRYGQEELTATPYSKDITIPFSGLDKVDPGYSYSLNTEDGNISVYGENLEIDITPTDGYSCSVYSADPFVAMTDKVIGGEGLDTGMKGQDVEVGDFAYVTTTDNAVVKATVVGLVGETVPASVQGGSRTVTPYSSRPSLTPTGTVESSGIPSTDGSIGLSALEAYSGTVDTAIMVTLTGVSYSGSDTSAVIAGANCKVTDVGTGVSKTVTLSLTGGSGTVEVTDMNLKLGVKATSAYGVSDNDSFIFYLNAAHESSSTYVGVRCDRPLVDLSTLASGDATGLKLQVRKSVSGLLEQATDSADLTGWKLDKDGYGNPVVKIMDNGITLKGQNHSFVDGIGNLYVSYKVLVIPPDTDDAFTLSDVADIQEAFGTISPENDIAYGCYCALKGAAGREIYAVRTRSASKDDFVSACEKFEANSVVYNFCPLTEDSQVMDAVASYNIQQSTPEKKHWRETFVGPSRVQEYDLTHKNTKGVALTADITRVDNTVYLNVRDDEAFDFTQVNLNLAQTSLRGATVSMYPGDKVRVTAGGISSTYVIDKVSAKVLTLVGGPATNQSLVPITLVKADTTKNAADYVKSLASNFANKRVCVVWSDNAQNADGLIDNKYLAATVAGLASAVLPQAPLTRTEMETVSAAPRMYTRYTQTQLDDIAAAGVLIITQDTKAGPCYIRHQLTTEMDKGVLYSELSCVRNLDNISYAVSDNLESYIGRYNITDSTLDAIYVKMVNTLTAFTSNTTDTKIGPSLGKFEELQVYQDPTFKTRVIVKVKLYLPVPLNNINVYLLTYAYDAVSGYTDITVTPATA